MIKSFPLYGWLGISITLVFWWVNWTFNGLRTHWAFFPLWLGFCLTVDAIVYYRSHTSLLTRSIKKYFLLFIVSMPVWWLFEAFNMLVKNWYYDGAEYFTRMKFFLLASLSFSVVMPAVFEAAELVATFQWVKKMKQGLVVKPSPLVVNIFLVTGLLLLLLELVFPHIFYFLTWFIVYFLIEAINIKKGYRNLLVFTGVGNWRPVVALCCGCLVCAFFWEMWNYYSYPKWIYDLPGLNTLHIFEMPLPGWIGYLPFSFELYAVYSIVNGMLKSNDDYLVLD